MGGGYKRRRLQIIETFHDDFLSQLASKATACLGLLQLMTDNAPFPTLLCSTHSDNPLIFLLCGCVQGFGLQQGCCAIGLNRP